MLLAFVYSINMGRLDAYYVLNFSDRTFSEFFEEHTRIDIDVDTYRERGTSKANRLRSFWAIEGMG